MKNIENEIESDIENYIDGAWQPSEHHMLNIQPATGKVIARVPRSTEQTVEH